MKDIVCVGGVTNDIFFLSDFTWRDGALLLPWKEKLVVKQMAVSLGGGGANTAVGFSRLGLRVALLARVGVGSVSRGVLEKLRREGVSTEWVIKDKTSHTATSVILLDRKSGERTIVMYRGSNDCFAPEEIDLGRFLDTRWLYIADLATSEDNVFVSHLIGEASKRQIEIAFTPAKRQLQLGLEKLRPLLEKCSVLIMNQSEWGLLARGLPVERAHQLGARVTVVTKDVAGVVVCSRDRCFSAPALRVTRVKDTTGAGDAFASGFIGGLAKGLSLEEAVSLGNKNAGSVISTLSAQAGLLRWGNRC